jgi:hypothetical protein
MGHVREYISKEVMDFLKQIGFEIEGVIYGADIPEAGCDDCRSNSPVCSKPYFSIVARKKGAEA